MALGSSALGSTVIGGVALPPYYRNLLGDAQRFIEEGDFLVAVIVAQTAAELRVESAITELLSLQGATSLDEPVRALLSNFSVGTERVRRFYTALSEDEIQKCDFWESYCIHVKRRNDVVHRGATVSKQDAKASVETVTKLVNHIESVVVNIRVQARAT